MEQYLINKLSFRYLLIFILFMAPVIASAEKSIGKVVYTRGIATAKQDGGNLRVLARNTGLYESDVLTTGKNSFAMIRMVDGTRMTLRPHTSIVLEHYEISSNAKDKAPGNVLLQLLKGGFRAITGSFSKTRNANFKIRTTTATIGIRGTEFDARLCDGDCLKTPGARKEAIAKTDKKIVARIVFVRGFLRARYKNEKTRFLKKGAALYEGDKVISGKRDYGVLVFSDKSRMSLARDSVFHIQQYNYSIKKPDQNSSIMQLIRGGFRVLTGLIAKTSRSKVKYRTVTATIGIRGTGFDIICDGDCVAGNESLSDESTTGMDVSVWKGEIVLDLKCEDIAQDKVDSNKKCTEFSIAAGNNYHVANNFTEPVAQNQPSGLIKNLITPRPDKVEVDFENLFTGEVYNHDAHKPGLYVSAYDGHIDIKDIFGNKIDIGAGEAVRVDENKGVIRLLSQPNFQVNDPVPSPDQFNPVFRNLLDFMDQGLHIDYPEQCEIR